jgi:hypothetical protein
MLKVAFLIGSRGNLNYEGSTKKFFGYNLGTISATYTDFAIKLSF